MTESETHKAMKIRYYEKYLKEGYKLISYDSKIVNGYKPDLIMENDDEVLFIEVVVTNDHDGSLVPKELGGKPVRFIKYYARGSPITPREWALIDKRRRLTIPDKFIKALGIDLENNYPVLIEAYPSLEDCKVLMIKKG